ncbi:L,D-transpeptidase family protein [Duganella sp. FT80W]|uniref:L,D-transpeptidase family protein n=2 Tax=Duganella guangzhouensis TaxID=2666084 RepID=A0A6I2KYZ3_9BURK|nr:L,D-transpeptidase family protein [Duganella guangzhouensis]
MLAMAGADAAEPALSAADTLNAAQRARPVLPKTSGPNVLRAQVLLDRAHFSPGEMDAAYGSGLRQAIRGFQKLRQLKVSGEVDAATWKELERDQEPVLTVYTLTAQDVAGPYLAIPSDMAGKAKLPALGYASLGEALGERFHASPELLRRLNPGKTMKRAGEQLLVPNVAIIKPLPKAASLLVDAKEGTLTLLDASGTPFAQFPASTGSKHDPLPEGRFQVMGVATNPEYRYNPKLFWDAKAGDAKARIAGGPNNPVGLAWIELSIEHYGIHGTPEPGKIGKTQSHGCVRLTNWDVMQVVRAVTRGATVLMQS